MAPYEVYNEIDFKVPYGFNGDCFDRYLVRVQEIRESLKIINYCINHIPVGEVRSSDDKFITPSRQFIKDNIEALIHHFKQVSESKNLPERELYIAIEAPKGEFGLYVSANGGNYIERVKLRAPGFYHLQGLKCIAPLHLLADVVTIIGTQDIVFGEVDR